MFSFQSMSLGMTKETSLHNSRSMSTSVFFFYPCLPLLNQVWQVLQFDKSPEAKQRTTANKLFSIFSYFNTFQGTGRTNEGAKILFPYFCRLMKLSFLCIRSGQIIDWLTNILMGKMMKLSTSKLPEYYRRQRALYGLSHHNKIWKPDIFLVKHGSYKVGFKWVDS